MARKERRDIDYFPFLIKDGKTLFILEGKYNCKGTGFFTNLFRFLSRTPDHHFQIQDEADRLYFFASTKCDPESALDMIKLMVTTGKLDRQLWEQKMVLASQDFLDSIQEAYRRRLNSCITLDEIKHKYEITSDINSITSDINSSNNQIDGQTDGRSTQSKVKDSKGKETKGKKDSSELKNISEQQSPLIISIPLIDKTEYPIYQTDISEWEDAFPAIDVIKILKRIKLWNIDKPKRRKTKSGIRAHITTWLEKEQNKGEGQQQSKHDSITDHNMRVVGKFLQKEGAI